MPSDKMGADGYSVRPRGGGEIADDDDVEGHGARLPRAADDDDVEGHGVRAAPARPMTTMSRATASRAAPARPMTTMSRATACKSRPGASDDDDVEGHGAQEPPRRGR